MLSFYVAGLYKRRLAILVLLAASFVFYGYWNLAYLTLLISSIGVNYLCAAAIQKKPRWQSWLLGAGITFNLGLLGYFKYAGFLFDNSLGLLGVDTPFTDIILPLGISFFTFQQIAYLVDMRKERFSIPAPDVYALSITLFPHLIAGPIILFRNMRQQIESQKKFSATDLVRIKSGILLFSIGLFKKVVIADSLAPFATDVFKLAANPSYNAVGAIDAWIGALSYALQLYFDFSGYSDMAVGLARMFGFRIPFNFNSPYRATSIIDFWRRWHISLMQFFREYIYIPLGGNRNGPRRQFLNILAVFLITGFWHGAGWTYILWGLGHGILVSINHLWRKLKGYLHITGKVPNMILRLAPIVTWAATMYSVLILWVVFRADTLPSAQKIISGLLFQTGSRNTCLHHIYTANCGIGIIPVLGLLFFFAALAPNSRAITATLIRCNKWLWAAATCGGALYLAVASIGQAQSEFLYFQF